MNNFDQVAIHINGHDDIKLTPTQEIYSPKQWLQVRRSRQRKLFSFNKE